MENCLGGSRRNKHKSTKHQTLSQVEQQQLQQQPFQVQPNYYTQHQQPQNFRLHYQDKPLRAEQHSKEHLYQPHEQHKHDSFAAAMSTIPKCVAGTSAFGTPANCLQFPPPPDYPPPPKTPTASSKTMPVGVKSCSTKSSTGGRHAHHHQQHLQSSTTVGLIHHMSSMHLDAATTNDVLRIDAISPCSAGAVSSNSASSSSATTATTIGTGPNGRRHMTPHYPDPDPDAIEVCDEPSEVRTKSAAATLSHMPHGRDAEIEHITKWSTVQQTATLQLLHQHQHPHHQHHQHDYSYAYYEPGAAMRHSNIPQPEQVQDATEVPHRAQPPPNSIRALLSKGKKNKLLVSPATRQSYQTRYCGGAARSDQQTGGATPMSSTGENFYEEISGESRNQLRPAGTSHSAGSLNQSLVEEEFRRVQSRHRKILGELNLSVEAMLMPDSPPNTSPTAREPNVSVTTSSGIPPVISSPLGSMRHSSTSADNICEDTLTELFGPGRPNDELLSPINAISTSTTAAGSTTTSMNPAFCGDLDSGFSGSSGASYIGSLRLHKTNAALTSLMTARQAAQTVQSAPSSNVVNSGCSFVYGTHSCRASQRSTGIQQPAMHNDASTSGFLTRASCGRRILNCAKIRAAEDPGPVVPTESKARSFWNRKGWRKLPGFSSTSSIDDAGIVDEPKLNSGSWEEALPDTASTSVTPTASSTREFAGTTTAQLHNATLRRPDSLSTARSATATAYSGLHPLILPSTHHQHHQHHHHASSQQPQQQPQSQPHHTHHHSRSCGSAADTSTAALSQAPQAERTVAATATANQSTPTQTGSTIAGGSFNTSGSSAAVGVTTTAVTDSNAAAANACSGSVKLNSEDSWCSERTSEPELSKNNNSHHNNSSSAANTSDEEAAADEDRSVTSSLSNQRNSQLRSTFNKAKQHLSFDKWRSSTSNAAGAAHNSSSSSTCSSNSTGSQRIADSTNCSSSGNSNVLNRRASCNVPSSAHPTSEMTTPGESPGGRLSRWFSIRRGSSHQYDVGGRDGRQSSASSLDLTDAVATTCGEHHGSPYKVASGTANAAFKMPGVPENDDDVSSTSRFDMDLMIPPGSRANGTARTSHTRLITPMLPPAPPGLSQQQLKRRHIVAAIVHSENSYVATLQRLVNDYKTPLEESSPPVLSANKISTLFHRLPDILQSHKLFRIALSECVRNWDRDEKLGDCFVSAFSKPRTLEIYSGFINNFSAAMELAKMEEKRKSALADFFKVKQISAHDRLSFFGLMVKPVQRFPQFILFLQDLLKYTPQGHHDRMSLQLALTQLELLAEMLNERKREAEQYQGFKEMLGHISGTFNTRSLTSSEGNRPRYLLREDNVTHMEFNQAGFIIKSKQRRLLLLNDKVICVSVAPKQSHDFGATEKLSFKWMYPVTDVEIVDNSTSATLSRILTAGLNRGGSLKSNSSASGHNNSGSNTLQSQASFTSATLDSSPAAQLTNGADNICNEMSTLMHDYEVISRISDLVGSLKGTYKELNASVTRNMLNSIQGAIQRKDEEMAWVDACCLQLIARSKSGKEETYTFQTQTPSVKKEWITELRLAQLALDSNNSPAWEAASLEPTAAAAEPQQQHQQQQLLQQKQSAKLPLFVKAMPVHKSQHQTEVRCGCYYSIAHDNRAAGNARRRHKQQNYLWVCTSDGSTSHIAVLAQHHQQAGSLRDVGAFELRDTQVNALEFVKGLDNCRTREEHSSLLGDLIWLGTDSRRLLIYAAQNPEQEQQLGSCVVPGAVQRILYHFDSVYVALTNASVLIYRRAHDGVWLLEQPQLVQLGDSGLPVPSLLPINMNIYAACGNRVYVLNALNGELQKSFEVQHGANQQVQLMTHSGIGLWISLKNSTVLCLYHTETFKHLQDINVASSVLRSDGKKQQSLINNTAIYVTALMACKGLLWVGTNVGIAVTIPLPRLEGVPIISGGISMSCHAHFGPITFLLPLLPKVYSNYKPPPAQTLPASATAPSMGEALQLPAIDADPKQAAEQDADETSTVILRRDLSRDESVAEPTDSAASSPRCSKLDKQHSLDHSFSAKIRASLANSPAFHRKRFRDLSADSAAARMCKTLPRGLGNSTTPHSNTSTLSHEHGYCDVYGLYGKLIFVKEDYESAGGAQCNLMDTMYEGLRRSDPELAAIPGKVTTLDRRLRLKASRPRSLDLSNWSVDSKSSSLYTSSGSEESMGIRFFGGRSVSRNSSSASHKTSGNGSDLGNISENGLMTSGDMQPHSTPKSEDGFKLMAESRTKGGNVAVAASAAATTLKRKQQKQCAKQQQQAADGPRTVITLMGGRGYWRHVWYNNSSNSPGSRATLSSSGSTSPLVANSNDAHIVVWEKKL